jgi:hypothetical protein
MNKRDKLLRSYKEYRTALQEAEKKNPTGSFYRITAENSSINEGHIIYESAEDVLELSLPNCIVTIQGKYLKAIQSALDRLIC